MHVFRSNHTPQNRKLKTISSTLNESGCVKSPPLISNDVDKLQFAKVMADSRDALARRFFSISHIFFSVSFIVKKSGFFFRDGRSIVLWTVEKKAKSIFNAKKIHWMLFLNILFRLIQTSSIAFRLASTQFFRLISHYLTGFKFIQLFHLAIIHAKTDKRQH